MSLTSYQTAPPRDKSNKNPIAICKEVLTIKIKRPGSDLLSRALRRSTIGAEGFHFRVRNGIGCIAPRYPGPLVLGADSSQVSNTHGR